MFNSNIIDLGLTLAFTYFILAMTASTIVEIYNNIVNERGKILAKALKELFLDKERNEGDVQWVDFLNKYLLTSPFLESLITKKLITHKNRYPSYIPAKNFSQAILSYFLNNPDGTSKGSISDTLKNDPNLPQKFKDSMTTFLNQANGDVNKFIKNIEEFFDNAVGRTTGEFKRYTQVWMFVLGLIISIYLNVDTVHIAKSLWKNKENLKNVSESITNNLDQIKKINSENIVSTDSAKLSSDSNKKISDSLYKAVSEQYALLNSISSLPVGWESGDCFICKRHIDAGSGFTTTLNAFGDIQTWYKIIGWFITTLAIYLGAPFWFELFNKIVNIRGTGKRPEDFVPDNSKDKS